MGVDSAFLLKENKLLDIKVKCAMCGSIVRIFINDMSSAGEVWPFCENCGTYVDIVPRD
jgi:endogenous inhibitor of DNA gyrase (YacG/DUF329 family)